MEDSLLAILEEVLTVIIEGVIFGALTLAGLISEQIAFADLATGKTLGLWYFFIGAVALAAGVMFGRDYLVPQLRYILVQS